MNLCIDPSDIDSGVFRGHELYVRDTHFTSMRAGVLGLLADRSVVFARWRQSASASSTW